MKPLDVNKLSDIRQATKYMLGCYIRRTLPDGQIMLARIVETEGYHEEDPASHTFRGKTARNSVMFEEAGRAYIYFTYGIHWCFNVTAGPEGYGAGILVRAAEPLEGIETMKSLRGISDIQNLMNGPAKLAQALAIDKALYGHRLTEEPLQIFEPSHRSFSIVETARIGISKAAEEIARFYIKDSQFVSKK